MPIIACTQSNMPLYSQRLTSNETNYRDFLRSNYKVNVWLAETKCTEKTDYKNFTISPIWGESNRIWR